VYATLASKGNERIRVGEGLPDETTPPPPKAECKACLEGALIPAPPNPLPHTSTDFRLRCLEILQALLTCTSVRAGALSLGTACPPERKDCSCLGVCGGKKDWNSPLYTARIVKANKIPYRYSEGADLAYSSLGNLVKRKMMFDVPMGAGII
jgi:hypothetical protein